MKNSQANKKKYLLLLSVLSLFLIGGWFYFQQPTSDPSEVISGDLLPDPKYAEGRPTADVAQEVADANYFTLNISPVAEFESGQSEGSLQIINPETNVYPIDVVLTLKATGEELYSSGAIFPNEQIMSGKLEQNLDPGEHEATATINVYHPETKEKQGTTRAQISLIVHN